jgi:phage FluMu protein Com
MKTCTHCLGKGRIIVNAGTGLMKLCPKCNTVVLTSKRDSCDGRNSRIHKKSRVTF